MKITTHILWLIICIVLFNFGYTFGGYEGYETQASYGIFSCLTNQEIAKIATSTRKQELEKCISYQPNALHQFTPFPGNIKNATHRVFKKYSKSQKSYIIYTE